MPQAPGLQYLKLITKLLEKVYDSPVALNSKFNALGKRVLFIKVQMKRYWEGKAPPFS